MSKVFDSWNTQKKELEGKTFSDYVHAREVWWCSLGLNLGREQDGKNELFERPVLIVRKFNKDSILIVPITSSIKNTPYHVAFLYKDLEYAVLISQIRLVSTKRLSRRMYVMDSATFGVIRESIRRMI